MMKKNKKESKGFTLIELLAVIVLLITISAIAIPGITAAIERAKAKQNNAKEALIASAGENYYANHRNTLTNRGFKYGHCFIPLDVLGLTNEELTDAYGDPIEGGVIYTDNAFKFVKEPSVDTCLGG